MKYSRTALLATLIAFVAACGGGTGGTGVTTPPPTPANALSIGVMTKGSVIVNGVHFDDNGATISIDDAPKTAADLQSGMVVKVLGSVNSDNATGTAQNVKALVEVRGTPDPVNASANPPSLRVLGQTVLVDDQTIFSNLPNGVASIVANTTLIEVHGLRDSSGNILATRIEANHAQMGDATVDEIRGVVSGAAPGANPTTFNLGSQAVHVLSDAVIVPTGATYQNGSVVEVHCSVRPCIQSGAFQASVIEVEDADAVFQPGNGERFEVEGLVSGFTTHPGSFFVAGKRVTTTASTTFEGGVATDLANDVQVEAEGTFDQATQSLRATNIEFKRSVIRLQGATDNATATSFDMHIANNTITVHIEVDSLTSGTIPTNGTVCVQVRGQRKAPADPVVVTAGEIDASCSNGNRNFIQAPVEAKTAVTSITLLKTVIDVSNPSIGFQGLNGPLTATEFFNTIVAAGVNGAGVPQPGTLVKVSFDPGSTVKEVEIEDEQD